MLHSDRIICRIPSLLLFLSSFLFLGLAYPSHLCYQEQYQLFEWTWGYFADVASVPGGFSDWCGRFLTQFFICPWAGAAIIALLLYAVQALSFKLSGTASLLSRIWSLVPACILLLFFLDDKALAGAAVAFVLVLTASVAVRAVRGKMLGSAAYVAAVPVLYFLCGPLSVLFVIAAGDWKRIYTVLAALLVLLACPFASSLLFHFPLWRLFAGIHYYRYQTDVPVVLWLSALSFVLYQAVFSIPALQAVKERKMYASCAVSFVAVVLSFVTAVMKNAEFSNEEIMLCDRLVRSEDWKGIISRQNVHPADKPFSVCCLNLALMEEGRMPDDMFNYYQNGIAGLFPPFKISYTSPIPVAELFWRVGMVNACQNYMFEAQEAIPDFQKSARIYKRLAETNIVNGNYDVARRYLNSLCNTLFYRQWARERLGDMDSAPFACDYLLEKGSIRSNGKDYMFSDKRIDSVLEIILEEKPENSRAYDCLLAWDLLNKDLESFMKHFDPGRKVPVPKHFQEAVLLNLISSGAMLEDAPDMVSEENVSRLQSFIKDIQARRSESYMHKYYGDTYWFYSLYR